MSSAAEKTTPEFARVSARRAAAPTSVDELILPLPAPREVGPPPTREMRARGAALMAELLRELDEPWPESEPRWSVQELLSTDRDA